MPGRVRSLTPRLRQVLRRQAETVAQAAQLLRDGAELDEQGREALATLLEHVSTEGARETMDTISWDRVRGLSRVIVAPHLPPLEAGRGLASGYAPPPSR